MLHEFTMFIFVVVMFSLYLAVVVLLICFEPVFSNVCLCSVCVYLSFSIVNLF